MLNDLPAPFKAGGMKVWPCSSRPGWSWFIAHEGKPYYFRNRAEAILFARDQQALEDKDNLCD